MLAIKLEQIKKKKRAFTCASNTCFRIISVVSFPKCFFEPLEMRKYNCKDVCGSLCLWHILKSEDSLLGCNRFVKEINIILKILNSLPQNSPCKELILSNFLYQGKSVSHTEAISILKKKKKSTHTQTKKFLTINISLHDKHV